MCVSFVVFGGLGIRAFMGYGGVGFDEKVGSFGVPSGRLLGRGYVGGPGTGPVPELRYQGEGLHGS